MENKKEVNIDAGEAAVSEAEVQNAKVSSEQIRSIYPEEDPRKFNAHYTEQEAVEYASRDHSQPITGVGAADPRIHAAHDEKALPEKEYPKVQIWAVALQVFLTVLSLFFTTVPLFMIAMSFTAGVLVMPNYRLLAKEYKVLGFNPFKPLLTVDIIIMVSGFVLMVGQIF